MKVLRGEMPSLYKPERPHPAGVRSSALSLPNEPRAYTLGPERWWPMPDQDEARGNPGGGPQRFWRANRSSELGI